ncbi:hypothetical protein COCHEDRAFT_1092841, partial [Bipolaris maydis C5]
SPQLTDALSNLAASTSNVKPVLQSARLSVDFAVEWMALGHSSSSGHGRECRGACSRGAVWLGCGPLVAIVR